MMNTLRVGMLLAALTALFVVIGGMIGGQGGMIIALGLALVMNFGSYWFSDKLVLKMTRAQLLPEGQAPHLHRMVDRLSERAGIPRPRLYYIPDPQPNAFATGRNPQNGVVAVNEGLLRLLNNDEVEAVIAHEIAHIKHRDTLTMAIAASIAGAVMTLANMAQWAMIFGGGRDNENGSSNLLGMLVAIIVAPLAATLIQMTISRVREFEADATAADLQGTPNAMISALQKLDRGAAMVPSTTATPSMAHMQIVNPLRGGSGAGSRFASLFSTHPPLEVRVQRLREHRLARP